MIIAYSGGSSSVILSVAEWGIRSAVLIGAVGLALWLLRVKDVSLRLAWWTAALGGLLLMPLVGVAVPSLRVMVPHANSAAAPVTTPIVATHRSAAPIQTIATHASPPVTAPIDWTTVAFAAYGLVAGCLLARIGMGLLLSRLLARGARGIDALSRDAAAPVRECDLVVTPVTLGVFRPVILLPADWREWDEPKLRAVIAHESAHVLRRDPLTQFLASIVRAVQWFNPLSWWLRLKLVDLAELASDDRAIAETADRASYAEILLGFFQRAPKRVRWEGVAMARGARAGRRIDRILSDGRLSTGASRIALAGVALAMAPLLYVTAAAQPQRPDPPNSPAQAPQPKNIPNEKQTRKQTIIVDDRDSDESWAIVHGESSTSHGSVSELRRIHRLREKFGDQFIWFARDGKEYIIRDRALLEQARRFYQPQEELGRKQEALGAKQEELGELQSKLGEQMASVRTSLPDLTRQLREIEKQMQNKTPTSEELGRLQSLLGELQEQISERQGRLGLDQEKLGQQQAELGEKQSKLGEEQSKLGEEQERLADEASKLMQKLFDEALSKHLAEPLR